MQCTRYHRIGAVVLYTLCVVIASLSSGCSPDARYKVLTFFFTGVPEPGQQEQQAVSGKQVAATTIKKKKRKRAIQVSKHFTHGPFGAGQCELCHAVTASKPFRTAQQKTASATARPSKKNIGPRLAYPVDQICLTCHAEKKSSLAETRGLWMHGPVANGYCVVCHSPHKSKRRFMLLRKDNIELCTGCHQMDDLLLTSAHSNATDLSCITCHNPHMGITAFLLKTGHDEWQDFESIQ